MKKYLKPSLLEEEIELEEICGQDSSGIGNNVTDDYDDDNGDVSVWPF